MSPPDVSSAPRMAAQLAVYDHARARGLTTEAAIRVAEACTARDAMVPATLTAFLESIDLEIAAVNAEDGQ